MVATGRGRYRASCSRHPRRHVWQCAACQRADSAARTSAGQPRLALEPPEQAPGPRPSTGTNWRRRSYGRR